MSQCLSNSCCGSTFICVTLPCLPIDLTQHPNHSFTEQAQFWELLCLCIMYASCKWNKVFFNPWWQVLVNMKFKFKFHDFIFILISCFYIDMPGVMVQVDQALAREEEKRLQKLLTTQLKSVQDDIRFVQDCIFSIIFNCHCCGPYDIILHVCKYFPLGWPNRSCRTWTKCWVCLPRVALQRSTGRLNTNSPPLGNRERIRWLKCCHNGYRCLFLCI